MPLQGRAVVALVSSLLFSYVFLALAAEPITREQRVQFGFQGRFEEMVTTYTFGWDGSLNVENTRGFQFFFPQPKFQPNLPVVVDVSENSSHVVQHFFLNGTDKQGHAQTLDLFVYFDFTVFKDGAKISLIGTTTDEDSEIEYEFENPKSASFSNSTTRYRIGNIYFDWADLQGATEFEFAANKLKVKFAAAFNLDPTVVSYASDQYATIYPNTRKLCYAQNRWWAFYAEGTNIGLCSSVDGGGVWSEPMYFGNAYTGDYFSVWQHGDYFDYVDREVDAGPTHFRRGLFNADGTVTWQAAIQDLPSWAFVSVAVDTNGYPWVFYSTAAGGGYPYVSKSSTNDGTWSTAAGYPIQLNGTAGDFGGWVGSIVALNSGKMYVAYSSSWILEPYEKIYGRLYNGSSWLGEETVSGSLAWWHSLHSLLAVGDTVYIAYVQTSPYYMGFRSRLYDYGWLPETTHENVRYEVALSSAGSKVYLFSSDYDNVYWRVLDGLTWSTDASVSDENTYGLTSLYEQTSINELGFLYTKTDGCEVKFHKVTVQPPVIDDPYVPGGSSVTPPFEEGLPANVTAPVSPLPNLGLWGLIGAVGLIAVGGVLTATSSNSTSHSGYRRSSVSKTRYSSPPRPRKTMYRKVKG